MSAELDGHAAEVDQAFAGGLDDEAAFDLLSWRSQSSNVKLRRLAQKIIEDFPAVRDDGITSRSAFDQALLTVDEGVGSDGDGKAASTAN
jgi:hypothetical protein